MFKNTNKLWESYDTTESKYKLVLMCTPDTQERVEKIKQHLVKVLGEDVPVFMHPFKKFENTAWKVALEKSVREKNVYIYSDVESNYPTGSVWSDTNSRYVLSRFIINATKNAWAKNINVIYPIYPNARSDKPEKSGKSLSRKKPPYWAAMVASDLKNAWVDYLFTLDIHNTAILSHFWTEKSPTKFLHIDHNWTVEEAVIRSWLKDFEMWSTDLWWTDKIQITAEDYGSNHWVALKTRDLKSENKVKQLLIYKWFATLTDKDLLLYDDMIDTAWTLENAINILATYTPRSVTVVSTHWLFNWQAIQRLQALYDAWKIKEVYVTDSVYRENLPEFIKVISTDKIIAHNIILRSKKKPLEYDRHDPEDYEKYSND